MPLNVVKCYRLLIVINVVKSSASLVTSAAHHRAGCPSARAAVAGQLLASARLPLLPALIHGPGVGGLRLRRGLALWHSQPSSGTSQPPCVTLPPRAYVIVVSVKWGPGRALLLLLTICRNVKWLLLADPYCCYVIT